MRLLFATGAAMGLLIVASSAWADGSTVPALDADGPAATAAAGEVEQEFRWERQRRYRPRQGWRTTWRRVEVRPEPQNAVEPPAASYRWERQRRYHPKRGSRMQWVRVRVANR